MVVYPAQMRGYLRALAGRTLREAAYFRAYISFRKIGALCGVVGVLEICSQIMDLDSDLLRWHIAESRVKVGRDTGDGLDLGEHLHIKEAKIRRGAVWDSVFEDDLNPYPNLSYCHFRDRGLSSVYLDSNLQMGIVRQVRLYVVSR